MSTDPTVLQLQLEIETLRARLSMFESILTGVKEGITLIDPEGRLLYANDAAARRVGLRPEDIVNRRLDEFIPQDLADQYLDVVRRIARGDRGLDEEVDLPNGSSVRRLRVRSLPLAHSEAESGLLLSSSLDVTEEAETRRRLLDNDQLFRTLTSQTLVGISILQDGKYVFTNEAVTQITGYTQDDLSTWDPRDFLRLIHPDDLDLVAEEARKKLQDGSQAVSHYEYRIIDRLGTLKWIENYSKAIEYQGRKASLILILDVTARKQAEAESTALNDQLLQAQKMEAVGKLAGGVAHDMNNVLAVVLGTSSLLLDATSPSDPTFEDLAQIYDAAMRGKALVDGLLGFARRGNYARTILAPNELVERAIGVLGRTLSRSIRLRSDLVDALPNVEGDPVQLMQVLINLTLNAVDAIDGVGEVRLRTLVRDVSRNKLTDLPAGDYVSFVVEDDGCGMSPEDLSKATEPFFTTKPPGKGTGLGLSMAYGVAKSHRGELLLTSTKGVGTRVELLLPATSAGVAAEVSGPRGGRGAGGRPRERGRLLVIDDEAMVCMSAARMLTSHGHEVVTATSSTQGIQRFCSDREGFDLVLLDLAMPGLDGRECFRALRSANPAVPVMICTGRGDSQDAQDLLNAGVVGLLHKPLDLDELLSAVDEALATSGRS